MTRQFNEGIVELPDRSSRLCRTLVSAHDRETSVRAFNKNSSFKKADGFADRLNEQPAQCGEISSQHFFFLHLNASGEAAVQRATLSGEARKNVTVDRSVQRLL